MGAAASLPASWWPPRRTLVTLFVWIAAAGILGSVAYYGVFGYRGDQEGAAREANAQVQATLDPGERVLAQVPVYQRQWWDYYRHTHGLLAVTNRRLLFAGVPPEGVLHRTEGPPEMVEVSFPMGRAIAVSRGQGFLGRDRVVQLTAAGAAARLAVQARDEARLQAVLEEVTRAQAVLRAASDAERRALEAAAAAARRPVRHLVQRGEALDYIARRYGVATDSLMAWNNLTTSRIAVGSRLVVRPGREP